MNGQGAFKQSGYGYLCGPRAMQTFQNIRVFTHAAPIQG